MIPFLPAIAAKALPYKWIAIGAACLILLALLGIQTVRLADTRADLAEEQASTAKILKAYAERARIAVEKLAAQKATHAAKQQETVHAYTAERTKRLAAQSDARTADQRLREHIRAYAADSVDWHGPDAAACRSAGDRSATLGLLLEDALGVSRALAQGAEQHASEVRFLKGIIENDRAGCAPIAGD